MIAIGNALIHIPLDAYCLSGRKQVPPSTPLAVRGGSGHAPALFCTGLTLAAEVGRRLNVVPANTDRLLLLFGHQNPPDLIVRLHEMLG